jgi:hypothetical protein
MRRRGMFRLPAPSMAAIEAISAVCCSHWAAAKQGSQLPWWLAQTSWLTLDFSAASHRPTGPAAAPRTFG